VRRRLTLPSDTSQFDSPVIGRDILLIPEAAAKIAEMLDDSTWARDLTLSDMQNMVGHMTLVQYGQGDVVFREGDADERYLAIILKGAVEIVKHDAHEGVTSRFVIKMGPGRAFGEMALIEGAPRSATAKVTEDAWLLLLSEDELEKLCAGNGRLGLKIVRNIARLLSFRLRHTSARLLGAL
jgi:CRP/FNR family transcriptional regulator, cyclic AMP receptor protein